MEREKCGNGGKSGRGRTPATTADAAVEGGTPHFGLGDPGGDWNFED